MKALKIWFGVATLTLAFQFTVPKALYADTYALKELSPDNGVVFVGMDDLGDVVLRHSSIFQTYLDGVSTGTTTVAPTLTLDEGSGCTLSLPAGASAITSICNNGHTAFEGVLTTTQLKPVLYTDTNPPVFLYGFGPEDGSRMYMDSEGDFVFDSTNATEWIEAVDLTSAAAPEPSSLLLLATGVVGGFGMIRRRLQA